ncbi:MAG: hypothetical protein AUG51_22710 [Acidobacteria bacterium 13_1_20CM_3_53_8]|nr:MAG: hypothetical protein AUG51_22710 [Acidobacteria bacterium 13_1_20CM_3_53_8]
MKYLHDSEETSACTKPWRNERKVICCWFFFYARGSFIQKSFEGLLHSILHQVLLEEPRLAEMILHLYLNRSRTEALRGANVSQRAVWPFEDLVAAFDIILQQNVFPLRLYLFLDALDEYEGRPKLVADFLKSIAIPRQDSLTQVKICFSSRPWNVFINSFNTCPGFSIHQYTKQDMWIYTESQLSAQYAAQTDSDAADIPEHCLVETNPKEYVDSQIAELTLAVVEKANGVFLWVRLVLNEFLKSSVDGTTLDELHELLSMMPDELEEFYDMIIRKIPKAYLLESYNMMEILLRSDRELSLEHFAGALACASCVTIAECMSQLQTKQISGSSRHGLKLKIESRCGGLVEILDTETRPDTVQFMHQTVKDFVSKPDFRQRILGNFGMSTKQNGHSILAKYYLSASSTQTVYGATVGLGLFHARLSESTTGLSQATFENSHMLNIVQVPS